MEPETATRVECQECQFSALVREGDGRIPADVVIEHGKESGHKLAVTSVVE